MAGGKAGRQKGRNGERKDFPVWYKAVQIFDARDDFDITKDIDAYAEDPVVRKWDTMMNGFQVPLNGRREGEWWAEMELVYDSNMYPD